MLYRLLFMTLLVLVNTFIYAQENQKFHFNLVNEPIDAVIVAHPKDKDILDYCINGIKENCRNIRRVIVVSSKQLTNQAEWFDEKDFPFSIRDIAQTIAEANGTTAQDFFNYHNRGPGWYLQQLLKLYAPFVIPGISSNVLVVDADVVFINPVEFLNELNGGLFCTSQINPKARYFEHAQRLVPGYKRVHPEVYSVCHHMLFQRPILKHLFHAVQKHHKTKFWKAFCSCVTYHRKQGASEYEIYFSYAFSHTDQVALRPLKWINAGDLNLIDRFRNEGYHFVAFHSYLKKGQKKVGKVGHE
jgi:hypothetical protein